MVPNNSDSVLGDQRCPKCGTAMEPIEMRAEGLSGQEMQLCPACYLVTWHDQHGFQVRQGVPVKAQTSPDGSLPWPDGQPKEC